jgi:hypothetical protein
MREIPVVMKGASSVRPAWTTPNRFSANRWNGSNRLERTPRGDCGRSKCRCPGALAMEDGKDFSLFPMIAPSY